ncbi:3762_t:CDS:2 [Acaulospora morrowiae]|uniref:3762_t:CDS:1 n=1 Tax=Acaulospora morrowiae TaxID=94023 RepID=A0A9N9C0P8_9GLOM|nr:3762_t:CDS:2 [Acaulospora morrowiae]
MFTAAQWGNVGKKVKNRRHTDPQTSSSHSSEGPRDDGDDFCSIGGIDIMSLPNDSGLPNIEGGEYFLPSNSDKEIERLQMQHYLMRCIWKENFSSPIKEDFIKGGVKVLDIQCGSGIWITDLATEFPSSTFIGVDGDEARARIQIELPNAVYLHHDLLDELPFPDHWRIVKDDTFDFVNQRFFTMASEEKWKKCILPEIIRVTRPGGYIEFMEMVKWREMGKVTERVTKAYDDYMRTLGFFRSDPSKFEQMLRSTNLVKNITSESIITPFWGGQASQLVCRNQFEKIEACKLNLCEFMNISEKEFNEMIKTMREEVNNCKTFCMTYRYVEGPL